MLALAEWNRTIKDLVSLRGNIGVEVSLSGRVRANAGHLRDSYVSAPSVPAPIIYAYAPRLVIDYEITDRSLHLAEVGLWEVVPLFRQVVVDRGCLVREDRLQSAPPFQRVLVSVFVQSRHLPGNTDARTNEPTGSDAPSLAR